MTLIVVFHCYLYCCMGYKELVDPNYIVKLNVDAIGYMVSIGIPIFSMISGYLYYMHSQYELPKKVILIKKMKRLMIPYVFWGLLVLLVLDNDCNYRDLFYGICHLWYLEALFLVFVFVTIFKNHIVDRSLVGAILVVECAFLLQSIFAHYAYSGIVGG